MSNREKAVALAKRGFAVHVLPIGAKLPPVEKFYDVATNDPQKVYEMWSDPFGGSRHENIGICTNNLLVLDFDAGSSPEENAKMEREFGIYHEAYKFKHVVRSARGGYHVYFRLPAGVRCASSGKGTKKFGDTIDSKSWHSYVMAPGSVFGGNEYQWIESDARGHAKPESIDDLAFAPKDLIDACEQPAEHTLQHLNIDWDTPAAISQAKEYLISNAPVARQGEGGDEQTYKVACRVRDFAVSQDVALFMIDEYWNQTKAQPPWGFEELEAKIEHAYRYAKGSPHVPGSEFEPVEIEKSTFDKSMGKPNPEWPAPTPLHYATLLATPPRQWIIPNLLAKRYVFSLVAPSGAGKTQWFAQLALAIAANRPEIVHGASVKPGKVWYWNQEDDLDELQRRVRAAMIHFRIGEADIADRLFLDSGVEEPLILAHKERTLRRTDSVERMIKRIIDHKIDVLILDPLIDFHEADENSNPEMRFVGGTLSRIAQGAGCAVAYGHHTRKQPAHGSDGHAGNDDSGRGASGLGTATRHGGTLYALSKGKGKNPKTFGISEAERHLYLRWDGSKSNIGPPTSVSHPFGYKRTSVQIDNGEIVGVLDPVLLGETQSRLNREPAENEPNSRAVAVADAMERVGLAPEVKHSWTDVRDHTAKATGESAERDSPLGRWPSVVGYDVAIDAGKGRTIEFKKPVSAGKTKRVILRCQAIVNSPEPAAVPSAA